MKLLSILQAADTSQLSYSLIACVNNSFHRLINKLVLPSGEVLASFYLPLNSDTREENQAEKENAYSLHSLEIFLKHLNAHNNEIRRLA